MPLPEYHLLLGADEKRLLERHIWDETLIDANMLQAGRKLPVRIRYRGGHTRSYPKKSYEIRAAGKTFHLNAEYDDPSMLRNALSFRFFRQIGLPSPLTRHCTLRVNGQNEGVYLAIEAVNRSFFRRRRLRAGMLVYAINDRANFSVFRSQGGKHKASLMEGYKWISGPAAAKRRLTRFIGAIERLKGSRLSRHLKRSLDIDNYLRWLAGAVLTNNADGFEQNYALYTDFRSGMYRMIPWDYEGSWGRNCYGKPCPASLVRAEGYNALTAALLSVPGVRERYRRLLLELMDTQFTEARMMPVVHRMHNEIADAVSRDHTRNWPYSVFAGEPQLIRRFIRDRREWLHKELAGWR